MVDSELQAFFEQCEREEIEMMNWMKKVASEEPDWNAFLNSDPIAGDTYE